MKWSPDGRGLLTASDDDLLRIFETSFWDQNQAEKSIQQLHHNGCGENNNDVRQHSSSQREIASNSQTDDVADPYEPCLRVHAGELIYDFSWYSRARSNDPISNCFAVVARSHPVHIYDATTGDVRASYRPYTLSDELAQAHSICFSPDGDRIYVGGKASIYEFAVENPGRDHSTLETYQKGQDGQPGIISCLAFPPDFSSPGLMAAGSFAKTAALYDTRTHEQLAVLEGHCGGITHLRFSADGCYLYSGARHDPIVYCWDARNLSGAIYSMERRTKSTNQKIFFDIEPLGRHLATGGEDGCVVYFDLVNGQQVGEFRAARDVLNGCQFHPVEPLVATASGERRYPLAPESSDSSDSEQSISNSWNGTESSEENLLHDARTFCSSSFGKEFWEKRLRRDENTVCIWALG